ncbi:MAG: hypothetical protein PHX50_10060 [Massilibacteroides sp.]|jgi:hypothetical protein|nr:hypothetical protein [Massilibacteroides sp.]
MKYNRKSIDYMLSDDQLQKLLEKATIHISSRSKSSKVNIKQRDGKKNK